MIILIGGESHTGKTLLAQKLLELTHYPYMSLDHLKMGFIRGFSPPPFSVSDDEAITAYLWGIVEGIIHTCLENRQNLIIEGVYLEPKRVRGLLDSMKSENLSLRGKAEACSGNVTNPHLQIYKSESKKDSQKSMIKPLFLCFSECYITRHFDEIVKHENIIEQRLESMAEVYESKAELIASHQAIKKECERYSLPCLEIQADYQSEIERAFSLI